MEVMKTTLLSWFVVTGIYVFTFFLDGFPLNFKETAGMLAFFALVAFIVAIYFATFGGVAWYILSKRSSVTRRSFISAGLLASVPMLVFCVLSGELEWILATISAGFIAGSIYALRLPKAIST